MPHLVQGSDGNFYGTTAAGGTSDIGTVFQMTPAGALTTLVSFSGTNGSSPFAALVQGTDGNFYGTTAAGGNLNLNYGAGFGTVFKMTPAGVLTTLVVFSGANGWKSLRRPGAGHQWQFLRHNRIWWKSQFKRRLWLWHGVSNDPRRGVDDAGLVQPAPMAAYRVGGLVQGSDGNFYGTTDGGGAGGGGTVFKMTPAGVLTTLVSFYGANGNNPQAPLVQGSDGNFYGTTEYGGANGLGTVFQVTTNGTLTTLVSF